ncbi:hypothetical protein JTB14_028350 [Gonioctena quinquepunctata]|nr:hypothetical protein JTB14_028350 [Gonioctena quinquepunctata]
MQNSSTKNGQSADKKRTYTHLPGPEIKEINENNESGLSTKGKSKVQGELDFQVKHINSDIMQIETKRKLEEIINLTENKNNEDNGDGFKVVTNRKRKQYTGSGAGYEEFYRRENSDRKTWLFLSGILDSVKADNIQKYIVDRTKSSNICVTELETQSTRSDN